MGQCKTNKCRVFAVLFSIPPCVFYLLHTKRKRRKSTGENEFSEGRSGSGLWTRRPLSWFWESTVCRRAQGYEIAFCVQGPICSVLFLQFRDWGGGWNENAGRCVEVSLEDEPGIRACNGIFISQSRYIFVCTAILDFSRDSQFVVL